MNAAKILNLCSLKLLAISCLTLGLGFVQTEPVSAQIPFGSCIHWEAFQVTSNQETNPHPNYSEFELPTGQVLQPINVDPNLERELASAPQIRVDADSLRDLADRQRAEAARRVTSYLGKPTAWQGYPAAAAIPLPPKQGDAATKRVTPVTIRSPFADFSTKIPTIAAAHPSQKNAETSFRNGEYAEARSSVEEALKFDPNNGNLLMFAAMTDLAVADYDKAGKLFVAAATVLDVQNWKNVFAMADQFYGTDDDVNHLADFFEFCETSDNVNARRLRGYLAFELQHFETAQQDFEFVINKDANDAIVEKLLSSGGELADPDPPANETASAGPTLTPAKTSIFPPTN